MRAGVVQFVPLEPDLRATHRFGQTLGEIKRGGAADVVFKQVVEFIGKGIIGLRGAIFTLQIEHQRHQRFGNIAPAELAEMTALIGLGAKGIGVFVHIDLLAFCAA